ncbi:MAG TPA: SGNH/GDSL hydrolase family protein [Nitrospirales bacterium]|nr:SGNH/GDSL hydrolase family protein [Nitrospirales bacterium]
MIASSPTTTPAVTLGRSTPRSWLHGMVLVVAALCAALVFLEAAIRAYSTFWYPKMMVLDPVLGWRHAPDKSRVFITEFGEQALVVANQYGHRGRTYPLQKASGRFRILVIGDSFTEGSQVSEEELFTARLEAANPGVEVLNAGVGGYSTVQEYLYLSREGLQFNPDLILLMTVYNDLWENCQSFYPNFGPRPYGELANGQLRIIEQPSPDDFLRYTVPVPFALTLSRHSYLFYFVNEKIYHRLFAGRMMAMARADADRTEACGRHDVYYQVVEKMRQLAAGSQSAFAVALVPSREDAAGGIAPSLTPIAEHCRKVALPCLSLVERLHHDNDRQPYFPIDIHWTREGHRIVAEELDRFLNTSGLMRGTT